MPRPQGIYNKRNDPARRDRWIGVLEHVKAILDHSREDLLDYVIANVDEIPKETLDNYITDGSMPVLLTDRIGSI